MATADLVGHLLACVRKHWPAQRRELVGAVCANALASAEPLLAQPDLTALAEEHCAEGPPAMRALEYEHVKVCAPTSARSVAWKLHGARHERCSLTRVRVSSQRSVDAMLSNVVDADDRALARQGLIEQQFRALRNPPGSGVGKGKGARGRAGNASPDLLGGDTSPSPFVAAAEPPTALAAAAAAAQNAAALAAAAALPAAGAAAGESSGGEEAAASSGEGGKARREERERHRHGPKRCMPAGLYGLPCLLAVEDPFNAGDNTARSVRTAPDLRAIVAAFLSAALSGGSALRSLDAALSPGQERRSALSAAAVAARADAVHRLSSATVTAQARRRGRERALVCRQPPTHHPHPLGQPPELMRLLRAGGAVGSGVEALEGAGQLCAAAERV